MQEPENGEMCKQQVYCGHDPITHSRTPGGCDLNNQQLHVDGEGTMRPTPPKGVVVVNGYWKVGVIIFFHGIAIDKLFLVQ